MTVDMNVVVLRVIKIYIFLITVLSVLILQAPYNKIRNQLRIALNVKSSDQQQTRSNNL